MGARPAALRGVPLLEDLGELEGRHVLVRADLNVPLAREAGATTVADDFRLRAALPTLTWLQGRGAHVTCCSHLGRPTGPGDTAWAMEPVRAALEALSPGVDVLENLRFDPGEVANDPAFVERLVKGFDAYVNDAFGASHRAHASIVGPPRLLPSAAGRCLAEEVGVLGGLLDAPARPFVVVLGGAKVADKLGVLTRLAAVADQVLLGGGMAFTFLEATGRGVGDSLVDRARLDDTRALLASGAHLELPSDVVCLAPGAPLGPGATAGEVRTIEGDLPAGWRGLDLGPATIERYTAALGGAATILWNGPMGAFEDARFAAGTVAVAQATADSAAYSVVGGGDSVRALEEAGLADGVSYVSTGGGATLSFLEHGDLPALAALRAAPNAPRP